MLSHNSHCVVITFPLQSHINPALQFAKRLARFGVKVTFLLAVSAHRRISNTSTNLLDTSPVTFLPFSDGYDDGMKSGDDGKKFMSEFKTRATEALADLVRTSEEESRPVTCLVYTLLMSWAAEVATSSLGVPSAFLWIQPAMVFDLYYYYFNGYKDEIMKVVNNDVDAVELPGLPCKLTCADLPSFFVPSNAYSSTTLAMFEEQFEIFKSTTTTTTTTNSGPPKVFVNTFDELEPEALKALHGSVELIAIGPFVPSAYLGGKDSSDTCFGGDMFESSQKCSEWLNTKAENSVVYVSFGSIIVLKRRQVEEIARGLLDTGRPFLWVLRRASPPSESNSPPDADEEHVRSLIDEINNRGDEQGLIVEWCSQVEVLSHNSIGCFVSHCGWNSTLEGLVVGVPMVAFPQWTDQGTNAKLIEEAWGTGVRVKRSSVEVKKDGEDGKEEIVESEEVKRCVEVVMGEGERGEEIRKNVEKWRGLARKAVEDGGSERNLVAFLEEMGRD
ncbi:hypothetical protein Sjap_009084 [Stephania japonica]|uniref:Glycosyltransferase n=1 Tax=Stephania japonica TaxID=461633 RepID=A0AAP0PF86_9MAGN